MPLGLEQEKGGLRRGVYLREIKNAGLFWKIILYTVYPSRIKCIPTSECSINETLLLIVVSNEMSHDRHYNTLDELFTT